MSGLDIAARGLAFQAQAHAQAHSPATFAEVSTRSVPNSVSQIETSGYAEHVKGAARYAADDLAEAALHANHPACVIQTANGRFFRLVPDAEQLIPIDSVGAVGDGASSDSAAIAAGMAYCDAIGGAGLRLGAATYALDNAGGVNWSLSNARLVGEGVGRTILRQIDHARSDGSAMTIASCENVRIVDMTLHGANAFATLYSNGANTKNICFERVAFTSDAQSALDSSWFSSTNGVRWVAEGSARARGIAFIDCEFRACGRMGIEFQNHTIDTIVRYRDITIVRPVFSDIGGPNQSAGFFAGMGISLSGYGENITITQPSFDNVREICIELVGASRVKITDIRVRADTLGSGLIQATNNRPMHGNVIDGLRWIGPDGASVETAIPQVPTNIRLDHWSDGIVRDVHLSVAGDKAIRLGVNHASNGNVIEGCVLSSDQPVVIENFQSGRNTFRSNRITSTTPATGQLIGVFGNNSTNCLIDGNVFAAPNAASWSPTLLTGAATVRYTASNMGKPQQASGTMVMASGTKYIGVDHGLGVTPHAYGVSPRANVGTTNSPPWYAAASNVINAQTANNVASDVMFVWWARAEFGNL